MSACQPAFAGRTCGIKGCWFLNGVHASALSANTFCLHVTDPKIENLHLIFLIYICGPKK